jgi:hypothetical protein
LSREWGRLLHEAVHTIPNPPFLQPRIRVAAE